jgi:hypothetical protein
MEAAWEREAMHTSSKRVKALRALSNFLSMETGWDLAILNECTRAESWRRKKCVEKSMKNSFVPLGTQAGWGRKDRSPDLRLLQPPSRRHILRIVRSGIYRGLKAPAGFLIAAEKAGGRKGALTVAGQWRSFTAFPNILAIAVVIGAAPSESGIYGMETTSIPSIFID